MKKIFLIITLIAIISEFWGCSNLITRKEEDIYTITKRDTTFQNYVNNAPGNKDNGEIIPSSRTFKNDRDMLQYDSTVTRKYPNYIRIGVFESVGLIGSSSKNKLGFGIFGIFPEIDSLSGNYLGNSKALFSGGIYRFGFFEKRLQWFSDAKNWTYGFNTLEIIAPNALTTNQLWGIGSFYLRKRYYLSDKIPYLCVTLSGGIGVFPSIYTNLSASLDLGSIGGLNVRAYVGIAGGLNPSWSPLIRNSSNPADTVSVSTVFPYAGIGISVLDFHNLPAETEIEWKNHEHSSWNVGFLQFGFINSTAKYSGFDTVNKSSLIKGISLKLANASVAIPILNNKFYAGTSLFNLLILGQKEWGLSFLPIRIGYLQTIITDELSIEPFIEYNYFPSNYFNIGGRLNLAIFNTGKGEELGNFNISLLAGYASGSNGLFSGDLVRQFGLPGDFSRPYIGMNLGIMDRIFYPNQLRYNK